MFQRYLYLLLFMSFMLLFVIRVGRDRLKISSQGGRREHKQKKKKKIQTSIHIVSDNSRNIFKVIIKKLKLCE